MAISQGKRSIMVATLREIVASEIQRDPNVPIVDFDARKSPGPITDDEWEEFVTSLGRISGRRIELTEKGSRRVRVVR